MKEDARQSEQGEHGHTHEHGCRHGHGHADRAVATENGEPDRVLTIRAHSGLSGDMFLAGLLRMTDCDENALNKALVSILPELGGSVRLTRRLVNHIGGWHAEVSLPRQHEHRTLADILSLVDAGGMSGPAKHLAAEAFALIAHAEATVHGKRPEEVHFHEVGALDSILDICMSCELFVRLAPARLVVSPLPVADGSVVCAHGILPVPAPAVLELMEGIPVRPFPAEGETVTPTAVALLRAFGAVFGPWPAMRVERRALVYGTRVFPNAPNGTIFAFGTVDGQ